MSSEEDIVIVEIEDGVAHVTLNRPEVHNAFNADMITHLTNVWDDLARREDIYAVVLTGKGKSFSAGADLNWMKESVHFTKEQNKADALALAHMLNKLYSLPQLTVARVTGAAMGGGMGLLSCCDTVVTDADAKFALSEVKLGLIPATIAPYVIRAIGGRQARNYFQTGARFDGRRAYGIGLAHYLAERPEEIEYFVGQVLKEAAVNGKQAMRAAKKLCDDIADRDINGDILDDTATRIADIRTGDEAQQRLTAFIEKR